MMKKMIQWVLAATLVCGASVLNSCKDAHAQEDNPAPQVVSTELIRTSQSWDGVELPDYFHGGGSSTQSARVKSNTVDWDDWDEWSE